MEGDEVIVFLDISNIVNSTYNEFKFGPINIDIDSLIHTTIGDRYDESIYTNKGNQLETP